MKNKFFILWVIWTLIGAALIFAVSSGDSKNTVIQIVASVASIAPLMGFLLTLGSPVAVQYFTNWLRNDKNSIYYVAGGIVLMFAIPGILTFTFNPYTTTIFAIIVFSVFGTLKQLNNKTFTFCWTDAAIWLLLWIPFDLRWSMEMHPLLDYTWWSISISVVAVIGWYVYRGAEIGFNLVPKLKDLYVALFALLLIMVVVIPPGILTGFLNFAIPESFNVQKSAAHFVGLFLTVALPEELFFRGLLYRGLQNVSSKKWVPIVVSSVAFGLMHWNNINGLSMQITYVSLATIAGLGYAWAYKKSGNNLFAAILTHTLVDWVWKLILAG
ncbi:MAG TPA: CPBP family intramembrane metalloprotease [Draconibacterium sp.]|nr:CPBP family intramembrane metalloprotease [Draconibacterium sp.]